MARKSHTPRTLKLLKEAGWLVASVEKRIPHTFITQDYLGIIDLIALKDDMTLGIQVTTGSGNIWLRCQKAKSEPRLRTWLAAGNLFEVFGWQKRGPRGKQKRWILTRIPILGNRELIPHIEPSVVKPPLGFELINAKDDYASLFQHDRS